MSPTTSQEVKRRANNRKAVALRQAELDANEQERKKREVDLAVAFMKVDAGRQEALKQVDDAEAALGAVVDELIRLGSTYQRCEVLVELPQDELRRLRTLARQDGQRHGVDGSSGGRRADAEQQTAGASQSTVRGTAGRHEPVNAASSASTTVHATGGALPPSSDGVSGGLNA